MVQIWEKSESLTLHLRPCAAPAGGKLSSDGDNEVPVCVVYNIFVQNKKDCNMLMVLYHILIKNVEKVKYLQLFRMKRPTPGTKWHL